MTEQGYEERECWACGGSGERHDITNADKIFAGPTSGQCSECRGRGVTLHVTAIRVAAERADARTAREPQPVGEVPDWMC